MGVSVGGRVQVESAVLRATGGVLHNADFVDRNLRRARLDRSKMEYGAFDRCDLTEAVMTRGRFSNSSFRDADLSHVQAAGAAFEAIDGVGASFAGANLVEASFAGADLRGARFQGADLRGAIFTGALIDGADFRDATGAPSLISEGAAS